MSSDNSNPILRRLGVAGVGGKGHLNGGRFGKTPEDVEDEALRLLAKVFIDETDEDMIDLTIACSKSSRATRAGASCKDCGDESGRASRLILGEEPTTERRVCVECWDKNFRPRCLLPMKSEEEVICRVCEDDFFPTKLQATHGVIARLNHITERDKCDGSDRSDID